MAPAAAMGRPELGMLSVGGPADLAVLSLEDGRFEYIDSRKEIVEGPCKIACDLTVCRGQVIYRKE